MGVSGEGEWEGEGEGKGGRGSYIRDPTQVVLRLTCAALHYTACLCRVDDCIGLPAGYGTVCHGPLNGADRPDDSGVLHVTSTVQPPGGGGEGRGGEGRGAYSVDADT